MQQLSLRLLLVTLLTLLAACSSVTTKTVSSVNQVEGKVSIILMADGFSRQSNSPQRTKIQNQYSAEQMAKIVAYRALAKQLYLVRLNDRLAVADQVIKDESFRIYFDLFLREARVVNKLVIAGQQKISLALALTPRFYRCFSSTVAKVSQCLQEDNKMAFTRIGYQQAALSTVNLSCTSSDCAQQLHISGFSEEKRGFDNTLLNVGFYDTEWAINTALNAVFNYLVITHLFFN